MARKLERQQVDQIDQEALEEVLRLLSEQSSTLKRIIFYSLELRNNPKLYGSLWKQLREMTEDLHFFELCDEETEKNVTEEILPLAILHHFATNKTFYLDRFLEAHRGESDGS